jgi:hypothetical protein
MRAFTLPLVILLAAGAGACSKDSTSPRDRIDGSFRLVRINETALPASVVLDGVPRTVTDGTLIVADSTYHVTLCANAGGATGSSCGAGKVAIIDSGYVWSTNSGVSFVGWTSHVSRALVISSDSLTFQRNDFLTPTLTFVR